MILRSALALALFLQASPAYALAVESPGGPGGGASGFIAYVAQSISSLQGLFAGVLVLFLFLYGLNMIIYSSEDSEKNESKSAYIYAIFGIIVVSIADLIAGAIRPGSTTLVRPGMIEGPLLNIVDYCVAAVGVAMLANIAVQGFRLLVSQGAQEQMDKAKKRLIASFIGVVVVLLTKTIVLAVTGHDIGILSLEAAGIANFIITFVGVGAVIAIAIAGFMLVLSVNESFKDKAKTIIKTCIVALIVTLLSYVIVDTVIKVSA